MRGKHKHFALAFFGVFACLAGTSIFVRIDLFVDIAKVITLPLLLFTFVNTAMSVLDKIVDKCENEIYLVLQRISDKEELLPFIGGYVTVKADLPDDNSSKIEYNKLYASCKNEIETMKLRFLKLDKINEKFKKWGIFDTLYVITLVLVIVGGFLSTWLTRCFDIVSLPTFTFVTFLIVIGEILLSDVFANCLFNKYEKKIHEESKTEESQHN